MSVGLFGGSNTNNTFYFLTSISIFFLQLTNFERDVS